MRQESFADLGIDLEEKAFYDILLKLAHKYDFTYPEDKLLILLLAKHGYLPVERGEVYKEIFEQAENFRKYRVG